MSKQTRANRFMYLFGTAKDLPENTNLLPTYEDMIRCYQSVHLELKGEASKQPEVRVVANIVAKKLEDIWTRASLPIVTRKRIIDLILQYNNKYQSIIKPIKRRKTTFLDEKLKKFKQDATRLFDICSCKCLSSLACNCTKERKIPSIEWTFIKDQRSERKMVIGKVDKEETAKLEKKIERKSQELERSFGHANLNLEEPVAGPSGLCSGKIKSFDENDNSGDNSSSDNSIKSDLNDQEFMWSYPLEKRPKLAEKKSTKRLSLNRTAKAADLTGVSSRTAAKIVNAVLEDMNLISKDDASLVVDKNKIRREVNKNRLQLQDVKRTENVSIKGLYFDGRKDETMCIKNNRRIIKQEEHIALIKAPGDLYFGHITLSQSRATDIAKSILNYVETNEVDLSQLMVIGCDGTNVNTGWKGGVIRLLETHLNRPLQWSICLLHANELPLRHLLQKLDGHTKGPYTHSGPIGRLLADCHKLAPVEFKPIKTELPQVDQNDLSTDQQYLYKICQAVGEGICSTSLAEKNPGKMAHSRWLTTANRILRLYVATKDPSENLQILATFVIKVYSRIWFEIKTQPGLENGANHLWKMISFSRELAYNAKNIIDKVIQDNAYFAHPENLLLTMLTDKRKNIRELAVRRILKARKTDMKTRTFRIPKINFEAQEYIDLIHWSHCDVTEPPLTKSMPDEQLREIMTNDTVPKFDHFPCHTQAVERCVKLITEASSKVCGEKSRDGYIRAKLDARKDLPKFDNKEQYFSARIQ